MPQELESLHRRNIRRCPFDVVELPWREPTDLGVLGHLRLPGDERAEVRGEGDGTEVVLVGGGFHMRTDLCLAQKLLGQFACERFLMAFTVLALAPGEFPHSRWCLFCPPPSREDAAVANENCADHIDLTLCGTFSHGGHRAPP